MGVDVAVVLDVAIISSEQRLSYAIKSDLASIPEYLGPGVGVAVAVAEPEDVDATDGVGVGVGAGVTGRRAMMLALAC